MKYTNFGKIVRKKMIDNEENLLDLANILDVSTPFISSVLTGNKSVPDSWITILSNHFNMSEEEENGLFDAYCEDKKNINVVLNDASFLQKKTAIQFQRKLPELSEEELKEISNIIGGK